MADATGGDLLLKLMDAVQRVETKVDVLTRSTQQGLDKINTRIDRTNDTLTMVASVVHRLAETTTERTEELERRVRTLEKDG